VSVVGCRIIDEVGARIIVRIGSRKENKIVTGEDDRMKF
jgi:hypothetical protein